MTKDEALKLALEALEAVLDDSPKVLDASVSGGLYEVVQCRDAITAIKAALVTKPLSLPEQEPMVTKSEKGFTLHVDWDDLPAGTKLYTSPPQREFVGLSEQEHTELAIECGCLSADWVFYGAALERKIKEKNEI